MSTNRITPRSTLIETLRGIARARAAGVHRGDEGKPTINATAKHDVAALRLRLRNAVVDMNPGDAESVTDARNAVVCEILLWEFGSAFRNDSQFPPMIDTIGKAFDADPALSKQFTDLVDGLRKA